MLINVNKKFKYKSRSFVLLDSVISETDIDEKHLDFIIKGSKVRCQKDLEIQIKMIKDITGNILPRLKKNKNKVKNDTGTLLEDLENSLEDLEERTDFTLIKKENELEYFDNESPFRPKNVIKL